MIYSRGFFCLPKHAWFFFPERAEQVKSADILFCSILSLIYFICSLISGQAVSSYMPPCLQCKGELLERERRLADENEWQSSIYFALVVDRVGTGKKLVFGIRNIHAENTMNLLLPLKVFVPSVPATSLWPQFLPGTLREPVCVHSLKWALEKVQGTIIPVMMLLDTQLAGCSHPGAVLAQSL